MVGSARAFKTIEIKDLDFGAPERSIYADAIDFEPYVSLPLFFFLIECVS
jgi:hypothetical protein